MDNDNCYILQDLNSANGTYINDCRLQNAAVRLVDGDNIRFGLVEEQFQFVGPSNSTVILSFKLKEYM